MRSNIQVWLGIALVGIGLVTLAGVLFGIDAGAICWPAGLVALGVFLLFRPRMLGGKRAVDVQLIGDVHRGTGWRVVDEEIWIGIGDVELDLSRAEVPPGETRIRLFGLIGDVSVFYPPGVGFDLQASGLIFTVRQDGQKFDRFFGTYTTNSPGYAQAERRLHLETLALISDLKIRQSAPL